MKPQTWIPLALFGAVFSRHVLVDVIAAHLERPDYARRALFYAFGGATSALLYAIVWLLVPWRPASIRIGAALACCWGIMEESQVAACRFAWGITQPVDAPMWRGICDQLSTVPVSVMSLLIPVCIVYWLAHGRLHDDQAS